MRRLLAFLLLWLFTTPVYAACTNLYQTHVVNLTNNVPLPGASVTVYLYGTTTKATLYDLTCTPISNPMTADSSALATFKADGANEYQVQWQSGTYVSASYYYFPSTYTPGATSAVGFYATGAYVSGFTSGLYMDYASSYGRFSVGTSAGFKWYTGGVATTLLGTLDTTGQLSTIGGFLAPAGTTTIAPIKLQSGTNLTTAAAGAIEYDGNVIYGSPAASSRGIIPTQYALVLSSTNTLANSTTIQPLFDGGGGPANGGVTLPVGTYWYSLSFALSSVTSLTHSLTLTYGGTATIASIEYMGVGNDGSVALVPTGTSTTQTLHSAGSTLTSYKQTVFGVMRVSVAGTLIPQITMGTNSSAAVVATNGFLILHPLGSDTFTYVGNWN